MNITREIRLQGVPISRGIAIGRPFFFTFSEDIPPEFMVAESDVDDEIQRYRVAIEKSRQEIFVLQSRLIEDHIIEGAEILDTHLQIMQDPLLTIAVETEIRHTRKNAQYVFYNLIKKYQKRFQSIKDPFFRERFKDIQDISRRILGYLNESVRVCLAEIPEGSIVIAKDLSASETAEAQSKDICAFITENGGATSHAAIVAKARGIPYVSSADINTIISHSNISMMIIDGRTGEIIIEPEKETLDRYKKIQSEVLIHFTKLHKERSLAAETYDGYHVKLSANLEMVNEIESIRSQGTHGIGLFRSEYIFLSGEDFPSEEIQYNIYKGVVEKLNGLPIVIRTFDVGGDKQLKNQSNFQKGSPFLGCRALRFLLNEKNIFRAQIRAILRAAQFGDASILFPMVSSLSELKEAKELVAEVKKELESDGLIIPNVRIGCMIEVPSAAIISDLLANECDFLSIGTNDLVQYSLAIDRTSHSLQKYYSPCHPGIIRLIKMVVTEANNHAIPVSVCGEIASDPRFTPLLLGLGVNELSLPYRYIPIIINAVRNTSIVAATKLAERVLSLTSVEEIMDLLTEEYSNNVPEDCFYNC